LSTQWHESLRTGYYQDLGLVNWLLRESVMGEAKRRKAALGEQYGQEKTILPWLPITQPQADRFVKWTSTGAWIGIGVMIAVWVIVRFIGPGFGWWQVN